jgi:hypothetical protein
MTLEERLAMIEELRPLASRSEAERLARKCDVPFVL